MNRKLAMSALGYAIVIVILLGVGMIISAPMMVEKYKVEDNPQSHQTQNGGYSELDELEQRLNNRISRLEKVQTDRYVCTIEGNLDDEGNLVPVDSVNASERFVFVCEYR